MSRCHFLAWGPFVSNSTCGISVYSNVRTGASLLSGASKYQMKGASISESVSAWIFLPIPDGCVKECRSLLIIGIGPWCRGWVSALFAIVSSPWSPSRPAFTPIIPLLFGKMYTSTTAGYHKASPWTGRSSAFINLPNGVRVVWR